MSSFEVKSDPQLWEKLGMDVPRFSGMPAMLTQAYTNIFLSQKNRPAQMAYFDGMVENIHTGRIDELMAAKDAGKPVIGTFCVYIPEEVVVAAGGVCVGLCGGAQGSIADAEKVLPRNICPMVKSAFGFKVGKICPYFQAVDFVYGETTCDAKKKTWELLDEYVPTHVMEIPQMKREKDKALWLDEVKEFKVAVDKITGVETGFDELQQAIVTINAKRKALQRLNRLRHHNPAPISGKDMLLIEQIAFYDEPNRFVEKVNILCDELEERIKQGIAVAPATTPRIMVSGTPMALPNWKLHNIIETSGAVVVNEESCIGTRYYKDLIDEGATTLEQQLERLTERYMQIDCSCFTPNTERIDQVLKEYEESGAQGIIDYCLQFCHTYNIEAVKLRKACEERGIPFMAIESDYSPDDVGQLKTRVEAFIEQIRG
ncbi:double-cubane-cluster-containing anaerobic reductase [Trichlorobacter sp.]|jgi:benzoyl-CoA reductase/2-hydroxyglutaryl-CoA dehydratase subunit BcrC/BadD/HgdB|uniref:double-cubane-cluster-containing anaerobic reductase n=1 Tax=Trichlorobacter sp. TaxID=2911007 RepID=UPI002A370C4F|nr:double-cubane-cluster-containing anaerobic reductase [Trichlorobacter sp.]MDY0384917.1 double-cubane-cluster-containing anaerobic reductase [Trichlorobacter sp.]